MARGARPSSRRRAAEPRGVAAMAAARPSRPPPCAVRPGPIRRLLAVRWSSTRRRRRPVSSSRARSAAAGGCSPRASRRSRRCASARQENSSTSSSSSRTREWKDSTNGFCHGEPGSMNAVAGLGALRTSRCSACAVSSGPLSQRRCSGAPRSRDEALERRDDRVGVDAALDQHHQRLARELVDDVEQLQRPPVGGLVELEVERPHLVGALGAQPLGRHRRRRRAAGACACALRHPQALLAPQPLHPLAVDLPALLAQPGGARAGTPTADAPRRTRAARRAAPRHRRPSWARDAAWSDAGRRPGTPSAR